MSEARASGLARGALVSVLGQWTKYVVQIAAVVVYSRLLAPGEIGLVTMATAITGVAWLLGDFGLTLAALQADRLTREQQTQLFWTNTALGAGVAALCAATSPLVAALYDEPRLVPIIAVSSLGFLLAGLTAQFSVTLNRASRFGTLAGIDVVAQVAGLATAVTVIALGGGYWGLVVGPVAVTATVLVGTALRSGWWPGRPRRGVAMDGLYRFGGQTFGLHMFTYVATNVDSVMIGRVLGSAPLGYYNRAYQLAAVPVLQIAAPLTRVLMPGLSARRGDPAAYAVLARRIQLLLCYGLGGALSLLAAEAGHAIPILLGDGWGDAVAPLRVLCVAAGFEAIGYVYYWLMLSQGRTGTLLWVEAIPRLIGIGLVVALAGHGIVAVAVALALGQAALWTASSWVVPPVAGLSRRAMVGVSARTVLVLLWACGVATALDRLLDLPHLLAAVVVALAWTLALASALAVPYVRRDLRDLADIRGALRRGSGVPAQ